MNNNVRSILFSRLVKDIVWDWKIELRKKIIFDGGSLYFKMLTSERLSLNTIKLSLQNQRNEQIQRDIHMSMLSLEHIFSLQIIIFNYYYLMCMYWSILGNKVYSFFYFYGSNLKVLQHIPSIKDKFQLTSLKNTWMQASGIELLEFLSLGWV